MLRPLLLALLLVLSCTSRPTPPPPLDSGGRDLLLARHPEILGELELPETSRPRGEPIPTDIALDGGWKRVGAKDGVTEWRRAIPFKGEFYSAHGTRRPAGMSLSDGEGTELDFRTVGEALVADTWGYRDEKLFVRTRGEAAPEGYTLRFEWATARERARHLVPSKLAPEDFALRAEWIDGARRHGLYLPAPARAAFSVALEGAPRLVSTVHLLPPAIRVGSQSGGAALAVELTDAAGDTHALGRVALEVGEPVDLDLDLARWAGQAVSLAFASEPGDNGAHDYVFLTEPAIVQPRAAPRRVLLLFADTLRADHTGLYGYARDTTPRLDAWAAERGVVFEQARSPASWTLPSSRAALSGREPERWEAGPHLGEALARQGFHTVLVSANIYLTDPFGFAEGWSEYHYARGRDALAQRDRALAILEDYPDRDVAIVVQTMDTHFAYRERKAYRDLFEGEAPRPELADVLVEDEVRKAYAGTADAGEREAILAYTKARYDQSIRVVDDGFADIIDAVGPHALTVFFSDHGEEWFEHGRLAHGHFLYDSSIKVPLIIGGPEVRPGRSAVHVGLPDILPTLLDLVGAETPEAGLDGRSLAPILRGEGEGALAERPTGFGWNLFGEEGWGATLGSHKYIAQGREEYLFDLAADPGETTNLAEGADLAPYREAVATVRGRRVVPVIRVAAPGEDRSMEHPVTLELTHPEGIAAAWSRWQHMRFGEATPHLRDGQVRLEPPRHGTTPRELFALPAGELAATVVRRIDGGDFAETTLSAEPGGHLGSLPGGITIDAVWRPLPVEHAEVQMDSDLEHELRELGYVQ